MKSANRKNAVLDSIYNVDGISAHLGDGISAHPKKELYGIGPDSVLFDAELSATAKVVYIGLTRMRPNLSGNSVMVGHRLIAKSLRLNRETVRIAIKALIDRKRIKLGPLGKDGRKSYILESNRFNETQGAEDNPKRKPQKSQIKPLKVCSRCKVACKELPKSGICRGCKSTIKQENVSRRVFHEELRKVR